jgi:acyl carrier protein
VAPDLSAKDVDGWDSLTHIGLIFTAERFSTSEMGKLGNVGDLVALMQAESKAVMRTEVFPTFA